MVGLARYLNSGGVDGLDDLFVDLLSMRHASERRWSWSEQHDRESCRFIVGGTAVCGSGLVGSAREVSDPPSPLGQILTITLPVFLPLKSRLSASPACSRPSTMCSWCWIDPPSPHSNSFNCASGNRSR